MTDASATDAQAIIANQQRYLRALSSGDVPHVYFNEFQTFGGTSDLVAAVGANERVVCVLHMSAPVAKTFALNLLAIVNQFEAVTGQTVITLDQAAALMAAKESTK